MSSAPNAASPAANSRAIRRKLVIVGDGAAGKTSLLNVFAVGHFPENYEPTVFDNYVTEIELDGKPVQLALWDTAGQEEYERLRPLSYSKAHIILIAFSVDTPDSLDNVTQKVRHSPPLPYILPDQLNRERHKATMRLQSGSQQCWIEEVRSICGRQIPVILVACKTDLRDKAVQNGTFSHERYIDTETGQKVADSIGAKAYFETSALLNTGVDAVFESATRAAVLVRDQGHGGVGAQYDRTGNERRDSYRPKEKEGRCCVIA